MKITKVKTRENNEIKEVKINFEKNKLLNETVKKSWQSIINTITELIGVKAGLIMEITDSSMRVFMMSQNEENPYKVGGNDTLCHGLYCETVIGTDKELYIKDARKNKIWKDNPDIKLNMLSYYGLPIKWEDGSFFGTICILDDKAMDISENIKNIIRFLRDSMEKDLIILEK